MFNYFDVIFGTIAVFFLIAGFKTGFVKSIVYTFAGFVGLFLAERSSAGNVTKFFLIFCIASAVIVLCVSLFPKFFKKISNTMLDRVTGIALGSMIGVLIVLSLVLPSLQLSKGTRKDAARSYTASALQPWFFEHVYRIRSFDTKYFFRRVHLDSLIQMGEEKLENSTISVKKTIVKKVEKGPLK